MLSNDVTVFCYLMQIKVKQSTFMKNNADTCFVVDILGSMLDLTSCLIGLMCTTY